MTSYETGSNFTHYKNRFSMPGDTENYHYSWDVGSAHMISFSTEVYFFLWYGLELVPIQYSWLEKDLQVLAVCPAPLKCYAYIVHPASHEPRAT